MDLIDKIMAFEDEELGHDQVVELFQELIDTGMAWELQGSYGRQAMRLIEKGLCHVA